MLSFKKAIFRALCLCCVLIGGGGLMASQTPKELFDLGMHNYDKQDFSKARKYFEKACDLNYGSGCGALGDLYDDGKGVEKDFKKALALFEKACDLNNSGGCGTLGMLYEFGQGWKKLNKSRSKDFKKALALF
ncbi:sel1 repeat family protein, partial [Helicobacter pylori]|nr:sel1 repeat family protein [Helicobacter pylori]